MSNSNRMSRRTVFAVAVLLCIGVVLTGLASQAGAVGRAQEIMSAMPQPEQPSLVGAGSDTMGAARGSTTDSPPVFLPLVANRSSLVGYRLGVGATFMPLSNYPAFPSLKAGWYQDWVPRWTPERPNGMEYVQTVRLHQELEGCDLWSPNAADRVKCPYKQPYSYWMLPSMADLPAIVRANPGSLWMIGNEMDRRDWTLFDANNKPIKALGQDEILPELYAVAYHDIYQAIKAADPRAKVAIGGVIQPTPLRLEYLGRIWDAYLNKYGTEMPVDVWNVHNFILKEELNSYGAGIPPGIDAQTGVVYTESDRWSHVNMTYFDNQIRAFRQWMKDRGQQNKPLIVSEYGVLYQHDGLGDPAVVQDFMIKSFDHFLNTTDCNLGLAADDCRLVQRWAWFNLAGVEPEWGMNPYIALFDPSTHQITATGIKYRDWSLAHLHELDRRY